VAKTLIDIDETLLDEVRRLANVRTKRDAVHVALREFIRRRRIERLVAAAGKSSMRWTPSDVRRMREER
jgi:Arc/MetJ family transcription regulator